MEGLTSSSSQLISVVARLQPPLLFLSHKMGEWAFHGGWPMPSAHEHTAAAYLEVGHMWKVTCKMYSMEGQQKNFKAVGSSCIHVISVCKDDVRKILIGLEPYT